MKCKVISTIKSRGMLKAGCRVAVALSGGTDSMALLHILNDIKDDFGFSLSAAHINHGIRGEAANSDEAFVLKQCAQLNIPIEVLHADVPAIAAKSGEGLEECGRRVRYEFFASLGNDILIATAHNADDRAETFLLNFTRGASLRGLCSIPYVRNNIIRPLLDCTKSEILHYCAENGIPFVTDATNDDVTYSRNRIRHRVIPELCAINPAFEKSAARCVASLCEDNALLEQLCDELIFSAKASGGYSAQRLYDSNSALTKRAVSRIIERETSVTADYGAVCAVCDMLRDGGEIQLAADAFVRVRKGILDFPDYSPCAFGELPLREGVSENDAFILKTKIIHAGETDCLQKCSAKVLEYRVDCDKICGKAVIRPRKEGDCIALKGRGCTKTLKKLFNEAGIPPEKRDGLCIAADEKGLVFAEGFGVSERCAVTPQTSAVMQIIIERKI